MSRPEIDTLDGVIYRGEDLAEKRYKRTSEITQCPVWSANSDCHYGTCMYYLSGDRGNYCCHPASRKGVIRDGAQLDDK